jgi:hypothetical protein
MRFMRKSASSTALRERARQLGVRPPSYSIPAAQAEVQTSEGLRQAASEIADQLDSRTQHRAAGAEAASSRNEARAEPENVLDPSSDESREEEPREQHSRSERRKAKVRTIYLHI